MTDEPPRYRIEHRHPDLSPLIVAFAATLNGAHLAAGTHRSILRRQQAGGELVVVDQETEADVKAFPVTP